MSEVEEFLRASRFQDWAKTNVGQPDFSGYHAERGQWRYDHNIIQQMWECWQAAWDAGKPKT